MQVLSQLDAGARRASLPLVCQQWRDLLSQPTSLWTHLDLDFTSEAYSADGQPQQVCPLMQSSLLHKMHSTSK